MNGRRPIPTADQTWLHMDRPNNLMQVRALMWFHSAPTIEDVRTLLAERMVARHPVFARRAVEHGGEWYWEDAPDFDLADHVREVRLGGDADDLKAWIGARFAEPLDRTRPLWTVDLVTDVEGYGSVLFFCFHHALADGIRAVQLMLNLCDPVGGGSVLPVAVGRDRRRTRLVALGAGAVRRGASDLGDLAFGAARVPLRLASRLGPGLVRDGVDLGLDLVRRPRRVVDLVQGLASRDNQSVNTVAELSRLVAAPRSAQTSWSGTPGVDKSVSWVTGLDLAHIKTVGREHSGTVNDVLLALVSQALTRYLTEKGALVDEIAWLVPVSLQPLDAALPEELGNHFALVFLPMPLGTGSTAAAVAAMRDRMLRIKHSVEPAITFGVQWMVAESPRTLAVRLTNLFANKGVGVLTNVPGPRAPVTFAGAPVAGTLGWVPMSGDQPLGIAIFSYDGAVSIGIAGDAALVPDPDRIAALIQEEYAAL